MIDSRRLALTCAAVALAAASLLSGIDRLTEAHPALVRFIPDHFQAESLHASASRALANEDFGETGRQAALAIAADPLDARGPAYLAAASLASGEEGAVSGFAIADRLSLRNPLVQAYFFDQAIIAGNAEAAAQRLDRLLLVNPQMISAGYFFTALERTGQGRLQLAKRLQSNPQWADSYLSAFRSDDRTLRARAEFLAANAEIAPLGCERIEPMLQELGRRNYRRDALELARGQCPEQAFAEKVMDAGFDALGGDAALGWRRHGSGDVRIASVGEREKSVEIANRSGTTRLVLSQPVSLAAGEYRAVVSVLAGSADAILASLDCGRPKRPSGGGGSLGRGQLLQAADCPDQVLGIWIRPGSDTARIDDFRLSQVGQEGPQAPKRSE